VPICTTKSVKNQKNPRNSDWT